MKVTMRSIGALLAVAVVLVFSPRASATLVVDSFTNGSTSLSTTTTATNDETGLPVGDPVGGRRVTTASLTSGALAVTANSNPPAGSMAFSSPSGSTGLFQVQYDGSGALDVDLTDGGLASGLFIQFLASDAAATTSVTFLDTNSNGGFKSLPTLAGPSFQFFSFSDPGFAGVDFEHISNILIVITGTVNGDYEITLIQTQDEPQDEAPGAPEPATLGLGLLGLAGLVLRRR